MRRLNLSPQAKRDIDHIWDYSNENWGTRRAERYVLAIRRTMEKVAAHPDRGLPCDRIKLGYFRIASGSHMIFYRRSRTGIRVLRVLHQSMDYVRHLQFE